VVLLLLVVLLQCCQNAGWLEALTKCHDTLEVVARALEDYFETKRLAFPRCVMNAHSAEQPRGHKGTRVLCAG
jgi:hypothetical protein